MVNGGKGMRTRLRRFQSGSASGCSLAPPTSNQSTKADDNVMGDPLTTFADRHRGTIITHFVCLSIPLRQPIPVTDWVKQPARTHASLPSPNDDRDEILPESLSRYEANNKSLRRRPNRDILENCSVIVCLMADCDHLFRFWSWDGRLQIHLMIIKLSGILPKGVLLRRLSWSAFHSQTCLRSGSGSEKGSDRGFGSYQITKCYYTSDGICVGRGCLISCQQGERFL